MDVIRSLGKNIATYIVIDVLIAVLVHAAWRPVLFRLSGAALAAIFILTILQCLLGSAAPDIFYRADRKITTAMFVIVSVSAALSFSASQISALFG